MSKNKALYIDMDGTLARFHDVDKRYIENMWTPGFYVNMKPFENIVVAIKLFSQRNPEVDLYVLSAVLDTEPPFVIGEKNEWLDRNLSVIDKEHRIFTRAGEDKSKYIDMVNQECFLLDDYNKNLYEFEIAGGCGIKFHNDVNHRGLGEFGGAKGFLWTGALVNYDDSPQKICLSLEKHLGLEKGPFEFVVEDNVLVAYNGKEETVVIPAGVKEIGINAFCDNKFVKHVEFPDTLEVIRAGAFVGTDLQELNFPQSLKRIDCHAFAGCNSLVSVDIPEFVFSLDGQAFSGCENLKAINVPYSDFSNYFSIDGVVYGTDGSEDYLYCCPAGYEGVLKLPEDVSGIGRDAFKGCEKVSCVEFNNQLKVIGANAFDNCVSLESVVIPSSITHVYSEAFLGCRNLKRVVLPDTLQELEHGIFEGCKNLSELVISDAALVRYCNEFDLLNEVFMTPCYESLKERYEILTNGKDVHSLIENANVRCEQQGGSHKDVDRELE